MNDIEHIARGARLPFPAAAGTVTASPYRKGPLYRKSAAALDKMHIRTCEKTSQHPSFVGRKSQCLHRIGETPTHPALQSQVEKNILDIANSPCFWMDIPGIIDKRGVHHLLKGGYPSTQRSR